MSIIMKFKDFFLTDEFDEAIEAYWIKTIENAAEPVDEDRDPLDDPNHIREFLVIVRNQRNTAQAQSARYEKMFVTEGRGHARTQRELDNLRDRYTDLKSALKDEQETHAETTVEQTRRLHNQTRNLQKANAEINIQREAVILANRRLEQTEARATVAESTNLVLEDINRELSAALKSLKTTIAETIKEVIENDDDPNDPKVYSAADVCYLIQRLRDRADYPK